MISADVKNGRGACSTDTQCTIAHTTWCHKFLRTGFIYLTFPYKSTQTTIIGLHLEIFFYRGSSLMIKEAR